MTLFERFHRVFSQMSEDSGKEEKKGLKITFGTDKGDSKKAAFTDDSKDVYETTKDVKVGSICGLALFELVCFVQVVPSFDNMGLKEDLLRGIYAYGRIWQIVHRKRSFASSLLGFEKPSAIQQRAIIPILKGRGIPHALIAVCKQIG